MRTTAVRAFTILIALALAKGRALATDAAPVDDGDNHRRYTLVDYFTATTLAPGELKLGFDLEAGVTPTVMIGTDLLSATLGAPSIHAKWRIWERSSDAVALGIRYTYLSKDFVLWESFKENFDSLEARIIRPSISWTNRLSARLNLHTFWGVGFGDVHATLSENGKRNLWEAKHPGGNYEMRRKTPEPAAPEDSVKGNQEERAQDASDTISRRTLQLQTLSGLVTNLFQVTGEIERSAAKKILLTSRIERTKLETVDSKGIRLTAAQQWIWDQFQFRLGIGLQYQVISGRDLDGELLSEVGVLPASDIDFYWRF